MKKYILVLILTIIVFSCKKEIKKETALIEFLPNNPTAIIHASSVENLQEQLLENVVLQQFKKTKTYQNIQQDFQFLNQIQSDNEILISYATVGKGLAYFFAMPIIGAKYNFSYAATKKQYNNTTYQVLSNQKAYSLVIDSTLVVTSSEILIENLIRNRKDNINYSDPSLLKLYQTSTASTTFFMQAKKLPNFVKIVFPTSFLSTKKWLSFELNSNSGLAINGLATDTNVMANFASALYSSVPEKSTAANVIPENASQFVSYNFEELTGFTSSFENFATVIENTTEVVSFQVQQATVCAFKVLENSVFMEHLQEIATYRNTTVYKNDFYKIPKEICEQQPEYVCFLDGFMLMANTEIDLQNCIAHFQNKTTWQYQEYYMENKKELLSASHIVQGVKIKKVLNNLAVLLADSGLKKINLKAYPLLMSQVNYEKDYVQFNSVLQQVNAKKSTPSVTQIANIVLDAEIATTPQWVLNHKTKQKEIIVQDVNNVLYLIAESGKIIWKKQLKSKIQGAIQQIDIYKNQKLQLAFTTENTFMVLDRNGKKVAPLYQEFKDGGLLPLTVFDYDKSRDYRFVITQGSEVFLFDTTMKRVNGFKFNKTKSAIIQEPKHIRIGTKDYIVIVEKNGKIHIINRQGKVRTKVNKEFDLRENTSLMFTAQELVFVDAQGKVQQVGIGTGITKSIGVLLVDESKYVVKNKIKVKLEKQNLSINQKTIALDYGTYTNPKIEFANGKYYIAITDLDTQKVLVYDAKGVLLPNFPVYGKSEISLTQAAKSILFTVAGDENALLIYKKNE